MNRFGIVAVVAILGAYTTYALSNPGADGAVFATVLTAIGSVTSYVIGRAHGSKEET